MQDTLQLGHFFVKGQWLVLALSGILGYSILKFRLKEVKPLNKAAEETIINLLIIIALVWKLSLILFHPVKFINNPMSLIYFSGGTYGFLLSLVGAAVYLIYSSRKQELSVWVYGDVISAGFLAGTILYNAAALALSKKFVAFYAGWLLLAAVLLLWQAKTFKPIGRAENLNQLLMWFSIGEILLFHFKGANGGVDNSILGFSKQQLVFYILAIFTVAVNLFYGRKKTMI